MSLYTRKQQWRRVGRRSNRAFYDYLLNGGLSDTYESGVPYRAFSDPGIDTEQGTTSSIRAFNTTGQLSDKNNKDKWEKRKVKFNSCVKVVLIISRNEYITSGMAPHLWYEDSDYANFKSSALKEYQDLMKDGNMNKQDALKELYQPKLSDNNSSSSIELSPNVSNTDDISTPETDGDYCINNLKIPKFNINTDSAQKFKLHKIKSSLKKENKLDNPNSAAISPLALMCA